MRGLKRRKINTVFEVIPGNHRLLYGEHHPFGIPALTLTTSIIDV